LVEKENLQEVYERGDFRTVLFKNKYGETRIEVIALHKIGVKYIHGVYIYRDPQTGEIEPRTSWDFTKIPKQGARIYNGQHWELLDQLQAFDVARSNHRQLKEKTEREFEYEANQKARAEVKEQMTAWNAEHPEPTEPTFTPQEVESTPVCCVSATVKNADTPIP
jgi:hypothetical protein